MNIYEYTIKWLEDKKYLMISLWQQGRKEECKKVSDCVNEVIKECQIGRFL